MNPSHALRGVDNPGMERVDMVDLEDPTSGGVFATDTSLLTNGMNGRKFTHQLCLCLCCCHGDLHHRGNAWIRVISCSPFIDSVIMHVLH